MILRGTGMPYKIALLVRKLLSVLHFPKSTFPVIVMGIHVGYTFLNKASTLGILVEVGVGF